MKKSLGIIALLTTTHTFAAPFDGIYVGINGGTAHHRMKIKFYQADNTPAGAYEIDKSSFVYGGQVGYAVSFANHIYTAAEFSFVSASKAMSKFITNPLGNESKMSMRAKSSVALAIKVGYNFDLGVAYLGGFTGKRIFRTTISGGGTDTVYHNKNSMIYGPLLGLEMKIFNKFTAGLEGRVELSKQTARLQPQSTMSKMKPQSSVILARLNYAF